MRAVRPGDAFTMTVTNRGSVTDTYDLSLAGPAALAASLAQSKVTLAPGRSKDVKITTSAINFALPGTLDLTAIATSEANPAVIAGDSASLTIGTSSGLSASLTPSVQVLPIPGTTSFLLMVTNTGNTEDSYTATITGVSGRVLASLQGLDGQATQTIPIFRLPALSSGAIVIDTDLMTVGTGTVSVMVRSLSNSAMSQSVTAKVSSLKQVTPTTPPTTTTLSVVANRVNPGQRIVLTATVVGTGSVADKNGHFLRRDDCVGSRSLGFDRPRVAERNNGRDRGDHQVVCNAWHRLARADSGLFRRC